MGYKERAIAATLRADVAGTQEAVTYCCGQDQVLAGIAKALATMSAADRGAWLDMPNLRVGGRTPRDILEAGDTNWFTPLCRSLPEMYPVLPDGSDRWRSYPDYDDDA